MIVQRNRAVERAAALQAAHLAALFAALLIVLVVASGCGGSAQPVATAPAPVVTAETGGMALGGGASVEAASAATAAPAGAAPAEAAAQPAAEAPVLTPGAPMTATGTLDVYADADPAAPRFGQYAAGTVLVVVEAGGDHTGYPVEVGGQRWYRVRAPDGLVGWVVEP